MTGAGIPVGSLSPTLFLDIVLVAVVFLAAASVVWFSIRTGISPMPSSSKACRAMLAAVAGAPEGPVVDLGSGWGTLAIRCARQYPGRLVVGYELSWVPWLVSVLLKHLLNLPNLSFHRQDFRCVELRPYAVLMCYLFQRGMQDLERKLDDEGWRPALIVSNTFALPSVRPHEVATLDDLYRTRIYVYRQAAVPRTGGTPA